MGWLGKIRFSWVGVGWDGMGWLRWVERCWVGLVRSGWVNWSRKVGALGKVALGWVGLV